MTDAERAARIARIESLLSKDFNLEFQTYYSIAIATCGLHPEQVNNELRNMLTHLARAYSANDMGIFEDQLNQAHKHLERAKRDCLKLANLEIFKELKNDCFVIQLRDGVLSASLRTKLREVEDKLVESRREEVLGNEATVESLLDINANLQELRRDYEHAAVRPGTKLTWLRKIQLWLALNWQGLAAGLVGGLVTGLVTNAVWATIVAQ